MTKRRLKVKKPLPWFKKPLFWVLFFFCLIFVSAIYTFFFSSFFKIKGIEIFGTKRIQSEDLEKFLMERVEGKNIFLIKANLIKNEILKNFPQVLFVEIERKFPSSLIFKISERKEVAVFCQNENCYLIDDKGTVFERSDGIGILKIEKNNSENEIKPGKKIIEEEILGKILEIAKEIDFPLERVLVVAEDDLHFKTTQGWEIFIDPQKDINWQITKLKIALENAIPKERINDLEYIDLRFGNFAYPKYKK